MTANCLFFSKPHQTLECQNHKLKYTTEHRRVCKIHQDPKGLPRYFLSFLTCVANVSTRSWWWCKGCHFSLQPIFFPSVSFHTDSGEIIVILLGKCFNVLRIRLGLYHRKHHLKELGGEILFSMMMYSTFFKSQIA